MSLGVLCGSLMVYDPSSAASPVNDLWPSWDGGEDLQLSQFV